MEAYAFDDHTRSVLESSAAPMGVYEVMDGRAQTLMVSDGLCKQLGCTDRTEAAQLMDCSMRWNAQPHSVSRIASQEAAQGEEGMEGLRSSALSILNNAPGMIFSKSADDGRYVSCNQAFAEFSGKGSPSEVVGLTDHDLFGKSTADCILGNDKIVLSIDKPHSFFEDAFDSSGNPCRLQVIKRKYIDEMGRPCILGMAIDVTEMMRVKEETKQTQAAYEKVLSANVIYESIVNALSGDYFDLYYVNVETDEYIEYGSRIEDGKKMAERRGIDFFEECRRNSKGYIYDQDLARVTEALEKKRLLSKVEEHGSYTYVYRIMANGTPTYVSLKATRIPEDDRHIIIGVSNVDAQMKDRMAAERAEEDRRSYLRLSALAGNLMVLYYVDPKTNEYKEYSASEDFERLGIAKRGADFFESTYQNSLRTIHPKDQDLFHTHVTKKNILDTIKRDGAFVLDYRLKNEGRSTYVKLRAVMVEEDGKDVLIIGLLDEDVQIRQEREYVRSLNAAMEKAVVDSLTGVKNKHAYSEWEERINEAIQNNAQEPFAVAVCDVNGLKTINDQFGHKEGDACIKRACARICKIFSHSPVFRVGGDEFAVILTKSDYECRAQLLQEVIATPQDSSQSKMVETIAAGIADFKQGRHTSLSSVFEEADKAMYKRKQLMKESLAAGVSASKDEVVIEDIPIINVRRHILIADDVEMNREILGELLQDDYDIIYASDGIETLEKLHSHKDEVALVLLDLYMPRMTGREVIAEMQIDDDLMSIPVIFLTVDQDAELDCLRIGAMDFIPKPYPDIEIIKARIAKCIELSDDRDLIRHTERDRLTGLLNKEFFFRYVERLDRIHHNGTLDAVVCDVNRLHWINDRYGRQFGDLVLHSLGAGIRALARQTDGIGCREGGDTFFLYCPHQHDLEQLLNEFMATVFEDKEMAKRVSLRFGVFADAQQEPDVEERFVRAKTSSDSVKEYPQKSIGFYEYALLG